MTMMRLALLLLAWMLAAPATAETEATFTLDGFSFISFGDEEIIPLPAGATIRFRFGAPGNDGTVPFRIEPGDVNIGDVPLRAGGTLRYAIANTASGAMTPTPTGRRLEFNANVRATLQTGSVNDGSQQYAIRFTTEAAAASDLSGRQALNVAGTRLSEGGGYGQFVGATTNKQTAWPEPGAAVVTVLSGSFDRLP